MKYKPHMVNAKVIKDVSTGDEYYVSEPFADFLKEHFAELLDGKALEVMFAGKIMEVFISRQLKIQLRNKKEA